MVEEKNIPEVLKKEKKTRKQREPKESKKESRKKVTKEILAMASVPAPKAPTPDSQRTISEDIRLSDNPEMVEEKNILEVLKNPEKKTRKKREPKESKKKVTKEILAMAPTLEAPSALASSTEDIHLSDNPEKVEEKNVPEVLKNPEKKTRKKREPKEPNEMKEKKEPNEKKEKKEKKEQKEKKQQKETNDKKLTKESSKNEINTSSQSDIMNIIAEFKRQGLPVIEPLSEKVLNDIIDLANDSYYNENPVLTDNEYDIIKEYVDKKYPHAAAVCKVGAPIKGKNKVTLPFEMASMDKIKPDSGALAGWTAKFKGPYVLSCKLDGVSGLYVCSQKGKYNLYTRGDGCVGQDISHLIGVLGLPKIPEGMAVRGEFLLSKEIFAKKYAKDFANARNLVSGIVNRKTADEKAADLHFVTYEVIQPVLKPSDQLKLLAENKFRVVQYKEIPSPTLTNGFLSDILVDWRASGTYDIDGIIVTDDAIHPRISGNPDHAFAFKMVLSDQIAEAKVVDVLWDASKDGYLKPRVRIEPIGLGGVKIEYATGFNGKFIEDNKIGIGAVIQMVRSGDVIPYIKSVTTPAEKAKMPLVPYVWNKTHVDILLENPHEDEGVQEKNITAFFVTIGVDGLAKGSVHKLYKAGKTTIAQILKMTTADFEQIEGFQKKTATKLTEGIREKVAAASLLTIMVASGKLGRGLGERKIRPILEALPDILVSGEDPETKETNIKKVPGIGPENAREFVKNIPAFLEFLKETGLEDKLRGPIVGPLTAAAATSTATATVEGPLTGKKIVMTKVRDQAIISFVTNQGGSFEDSMKKDVFVLIVKSKEDSSNKTEYATKNGIPIMTVEEFKKEYM